MTSFWNAGPAGPGWAPWGLTEFFERLREWNEARPEKAFVPDAAVWHDYGWGTALGLTDDLRHGVDHVRRVLEANGFPSDAELWVTEWNEIWGADPTCLEVTDGQRAAHLARNVVQQLASGGTPGITRAHWFSSDEDYGCTGTALWTVPGSQAGPCKHLAYHAVQALHSMVTGRYIEALTAEPLVAMATRDDDDRVAAIVVNHTAAPTTAEIIFTKLPFPGPSMRRTVQRIDAAFAGCDGLEPGETAVVPTTPGGSLGLSIELPAESVRLVTLAPA